MLKQAQPPLHEEFAQLNLEVVPSGFLSNLEIKPSLEEKLKRLKSKILTLVRSNRTLLVGMLIVSLLIIKIPFILVNILLYRTIET
jgi:hypothetical protein